MSARFKMGSVQPLAYKAMDALDKYVSNASLEPRYKELIRIRASQINGCAYCVNYHSGDALKLGESPQKLLLLNVWRESPNVFSKEEQLLLEMTEELTFIHRHGLSDDVYERLIATFGEEKTAQAIMTAIVINAWNRIGVGLKMEPEMD
ncbi:MAG TPA: carboxymuconolactone decarboxylase family protein [Chitinophagaceae bacterium]|nr:carboxymuconolactone decarboxylase family protein [Chitinophagaceae bacterium]